MGREREYKRESDTAALIRRRATNNKKIKRRPQRREGPTPHSKQTRSLPHSLTHSASSSPASVLQQQQRQRQQQRQQHNTCTPPLPLFAAHCCTIASSHATDACLTSSVDTHPPSFDNKSDPHSQQSRGLCLALLALLFSSLAASPLLVVRPFGLHVHGRCCG